MYVKFIIDKAADYAFKELDKPGKDINNLPGPLKIVVIIYSAQRIISNGGFEYFFERDFPGNPPYSMFSDAYREIKAIEDADYLDKAVSMFPFKEPHLYQDKRKNFMRENAYDDSKEFTQLGERVCVNETVWEKLVDYIVSHKNHFPIIN